MEEYVYQFCDLSYQVPLYDESLFKDLFYFGLNSHIKAMFNKSLFSGGVYNGSLRGLMDYALLYAGSSFTVGVAEEEGDTMPLTKMATTPADPPLVVVQAAGIPRSAALSAPSQELGEPLQSPLRPGSSQSPLQSPLRPRSSQSPLQSPLRSGSSQSPLQSPLRPGSSQSPLQRPLRAGSSQSPLQRPLRAGSSQSPLQRPLRAGSLQSPLQRPLWSAGLACRMSSSSFIFGLAVGGRVAFPPLQSVLSPPAGRVCGDTVGSPLQRSDPVLATCQSSTSHSINPGKDAKGSPSWRRVPLLPGLLDTPSQVCLPLHDTLLPLSHFIHEWERLPGVSLWVLRTIRSGYTLQFWEIPPHLDGVQLTVVNSASKASVLQL